MHGAWGLSAFLWRKARLTVCAVVIALALAGGLSFASVVLAGRLSVSAESAVLIAVLLVACAVGDTVLEQVLLMLATVAQTRSDEAVQDLTLSVAIATARRQGVTWRESSDPASVQLRTVISDRRAPYCFTGLVQYLGVRVTGWLAFAAALGVFPVFAVVIAAAQVFQSVAGARYLDASQASSDDPRGAKTREADSWLGMAAGDPHDAHMRVFGYTRFALERHAQLWRTAMSRDRVHWSAPERASRLASMVGDVVFVVCIVVFAVLVWQGVYQPGDTLVFLVMAIRLLSLGPVGEVQFQAAACLKRHDAMAAIRQLLFDGADQPMDPPSAEPLPGVYRIRAAHTYQDGGFTIRADVDLPVGAIVAVTGDNGSGKTTWLSCLAGVIDTPISVTTPDGDFWHSADLRRHALLLRYGGASWEESVDDLDAEQGINPAEVRVTGIVTDAMLTRPLADLSTGQRQRASLARHLAYVRLHEVPLLLVDEPTASVDRPTSAGMVAAIRRYLPGTTILIVTHDQEVAGQCDQILHVANGELVTA